MFYLYVIFCSFVMKIKTIKLATITPIIRLDKVKRGLAPIVIRVTVKRKKSLLSIGHRIDPKYWDEENSRVKKSFDNSVRLNNLIKNYISKIDNYIITKEVENESVNFDEIKERVFMKNNTSNTFKSFSLRYLEQLNKEKKYSQFGSSRSQINKMIDFFGENATFSSVSVVSVLKFKSYLSVSYNQKERSIVNHLIVLRALCNRAIREGLMSKNDYPFGLDGVKVKIPPSQKIGLNSEEIELIEDSKIKAFTTQWHARNAFLLSFYFAGARISDVLRIKWTDIVDGRLYYVMGKNKKVGSVKVTEQAQLILDTYKDKRKSGENFVLPDLNKANIDDEVDVYRKIITATKNYNKWLGRLAKNVGIKKKVTCHIARHSFGNISGDKIPVQMLQKLYRHSSIATTINYQQSFINNDTDDALEKVLNG